jgi:hypothetical protein
MKHFSKSMALVGLIVVAAGAHGTVTMSANTNWGSNGDGWWSPAESGGYLGTVNQNRSMSFNPVTNKVYLANDLSVRVLNASTGASEAFLDVTGIGGGARALNTVGVASDGSIYGTNLTTATNSSPYRIYRWANQAAAPTVAYSGNVGFAAAGPRVGDNFAVFGSGSSLQMAGGYSNNPAGFNGFATSDGVTAQHNAFAGSPPANGEFRLGIAFADANTIIGTQGAGGTGRMGIATRSGSTWSYAGNVVLTSASERGLGVTVVNGYRLLGTIDSANSRVRVYDITTLPTSGTLVALAEGNLTSGTLTGNGNGTAAVTWGLPTFNSAGVATVPLYAMSTNQGIQSFNVQVVPEPATMAALGLGVAAMIRRRKKS